MSVSVHAPLVSVIIPTHNRLHYLPEAVESVFAQCYANWELIIVDDGSSDGTTDYLQALAGRDHRVSGIFHPHCANPARLRNIGVAGARGDYIAFLDSDDLWLPDKLTVQVGRLHQDPRCRWSYTADMLIGAHGEKIAFVPDVPLLQPSGWILDALLRAVASVSLPSVLVERSLFLDSGGFDETFRYCEDTELWCRLAVRSPVLFVPEILVKVRRHSTNFSDQPEAMVRGWLPLYQQVFRTTDSRQVKAVCKQQMARRMVWLADYYGAAGEPGRALAMLRSAFGHRPIYGAW
jgi:GT2 family glycosyltransferase